jgi:hypothetical protein
MSATFHFTYEKDWRTAPVANWIHVPVPDAPSHYEPPAPLLTPHKGYRFLRVQYGEHELQFSSPPQLSHFIEVLEKKPLPTTRQLSAKRGSSIGPNGHWLSRLPASLKSPRNRAKLVQALRVISKQVNGNSTDQSFVDTAARGVRGES